MRLARGAVTRSATRSRWAHALSVWAKRPPCQPNATRHPVRTRAALAAPALRCNPAAAARRRPMCRLLRRSGNKSPSNCPNRSRRRSPALFQKTSIFPSSKNDSASRPIGLDQTPRSVGKGPCKGCSGRSVWIVVVSKVKWVMSSSLIPKE